MAHCTQSVRHHCLCGPFKHLINSQRTLNHNTGGNTSRTDNFRNACCLRERESTTNRARSQIKRSSLRHLITKLARSETVRSRVLLLKRSGKVMLSGCDRSASRNRLRGVEQVEHSKSACHSVSKCFSPRFTLQNRQVRFSSESRKPGNFSHRDSREFHRAKSAIPLRNRSKVCM